MARTIGEWEKEIEALPTSSVEYFMDAIDTLNGWSAFKEGWGWTGLGILRTLLWDELRKRGKT